MATNAKNLAELLNTDTTVAATDVADNSITAAKLDIVGNGTSGQFLKTDGDGSFSYINAPTVQTPTQQIFTTVGTATWTKPTGCTKVKVTVIAGGGGSGGAKAVAGGGHPSSSNHMVSGGAGGGGGTSIKLLDVSSIASVTVTIGDGGNGGTASTTGGAAQGTTGGTSSFGTYATATGGVGGWGGGYTGNAQSNQDILGYPGTGGTAADGDINLKGEDGLMSSFDDFNKWKPNTNYYTGARGGMAAGLSAGNSRNDGTSSSGGSQGDANTGNGAQASLVRSGFAAMAGSKGGTGIVIVDEFYS